MPVNYQALYDLSLSPDPAKRKVAEQASRKLTPQEFQEFFKFQKQAHSGTDAGVGIGGSNDVIPALGGAAGAGMLPNMIPSGLDLSPSGIVGGVKAGASAASAATSAAIKNNPKTSMAVIGGGIQMLPFVPPGVKNAIETALMMKMMGPDGSPAGPKTDEELVAEMKAKGAGMGKRVEPTPVQPRRPASSTPSDPTGGIPDSAGSGFGAKVKSQSASSPSDWKGPMGDEANWRDVGSSPTPVQRRTPNNVQPNSPQQSLATGDEVDRRRVLFGGADGGPPYTPPDQKKPIGRRKPK